MYQRIRKKANETLKHKYTYNNAQKKPVLLTPLDTIFELFYINKNTLIMFCFDTHLARHKEQKSETEMKKQTCQTNLQLNTEWHIHII